MDQIRKKRKERVEGDSKDFESLNLLDHHAIHRNCIRSGEIINEYLSFRLYFVININLNL